MRVVSYRLWIILIFFIALLPINTVSAFGLMQAYEAALNNDALYQAAIHENEAGQQFKTIGRASLLPVLSGSYSTNYVDADRTFNGMNRPVKLPQRNRFTPAASTGDQL